jgi:hypothetical protein
VPAGARTFDASGKTVIPGLIDTHAHLHYSGFELFPEAKWEYVANLAYGVTTVYDPSAPSLDVFAQGEQVEAGLMVGPRVYSSGDVLYGGQQAGIFAEVNNLDDAKHQVRRMKAYGARMIKVYQQPRRSQRIYFAEACRDEHMLLTAEGNGEVRHGHVDGAGRIHGVGARAARSASARTSSSFVAKSGPSTRRRCSSPTEARGARSTTGRRHNAHDDAKLNRFVPHDVIDAKAPRYPWIWPPSTLPDRRARRGGGAPRRRQRLARRARQLQGLGPTGRSGRWPGGRREGLRDDADGGAARVDDLAATRSASRRTWGRSRPASSRT